jgi:hypothetical protein
MDARGLANRAVTSGPVTLDATRGYMAWSRKWVTTSWMVPNKAKGHYNASVLLQTGWVAKLGIGFEILTVLSLENLSSPCQEQAPPENLADNKK